MKNCQGGIITMVNDVKKAAIEARKAYQKEWREKNRDKIRQYNERYWTRKVERAKEAANG